MRGYLCMWLGNYVCGWGVRIAVFWFAGYLILSYVGCVLDGRDLRRILVVMGRGYRLINVCVTTRHLKIVWKKLL